MRPCSLVGGLSVNADWYSAVLASSAVLLRQVGRVLRESPSSRALLALVRRLTQSALIQRHALEAGVTTLNGQVATPTTIVRSGDALQFVPTPPHLCSRDTLLTTTTILSLSERFQEHRPPSRAPDLDPPDSNHLRGPERAIYRHRQAWRHARPSYRTLHEEHGDRDAHL